MVSVKENKVAFSETYFSLFTWETSPLRLAAAPELEQIVQLSQEVPLAAAIADPSGRLQWTIASPDLQEFTESINFIVGANAVSLALAHKRPYTLSTAEHRLPACHETICYAAPIIHPQSGQLVGVLDISIGGKQLSPLFEKAVECMAGAIAQRLPLCLPRADLDIHALGQAWVVFRGQRLHLSPRQLEILCILALHPAGMALDALHHALNGDIETPTGSIKSILTQLRHLLDGQIGSQPYRLLMPVWADFLELPNALHMQHLNEALTLYQGALLPTSSAPAIAEWRNHLDAGMETLLLSCTNPHVLAEHAGNLLCTALVRERFLELLV